MVYHIPSPNTLSPEHVVLGELRQAPAHGYELHQRVARDFGDLWHLRFNQIYGILHRLETEGFVIGNTEKGANAPARRSYRITQAGEAHFDDWLRRPTACNVRVIRVEFMTRLFFASRSDAALANRILREQIEITRLSLERQREALAAVPSSERFSQLGVALRVRTLAGVLEWLNDCETAVRDLGAVAEAAGDLFQLPQIPPRLSA